MTKTTKVVNNLFMNIPMTIVFCWFVQQLAIWSGAAPAFDWKSFFLNLPIGYVTGFFIGLIFPSVPWGMRFASACGAKEGSWKYNALVNLIVNTVNTTALIIVMTDVNVCLFGHAPLQALIPGILDCYVPVWIVAYFVSYFTKPICLKLAQKCMKAI